MFPAGTASTTIVLLPYYSKGFPDWQPLVLEPGQRIKQLPLPAGRLCCFLCCNRDKRGQLLVGMLLSLPLLLRVEPNLNLYLLLVVLKWVLMPLLWVVRVPPL